MKYRKIQFVAVSFFVMTFVTVVVFLGYYKIYDKNEMFHFLHLNQTKNSSFQGQHNKKVRKNFTIYLDEKIDSAHFLELLCFLEHAKAKYIVLPNSLGYFMNYHALDEVRSFIQRDEERFIGTSLWQSRKTPFVQKGGMTYGSFIRSENRFYLANYANSEREEEKPFQFQKYRFAPCNEDMRFHFVYKTDNKHVFTLPFLLYLRFNCPGKIQEVDFTAESVKIGDKNFYYDAQGRFYFQTVFDSPMRMKKALFSEMKEYFLSREELLSDLIALKILPENVRISEDYVWIEKTMDRLYLREKLPKAEHNQILESAKKQAAAWKNFKRKYGELVSDAIIFLVPGKQGNWPESTMGQLYTMEKAVSLRVLPYPLSLLLAFLFFLGMLICTWVVCSYFTSFLVLFVALCSNVIFYFYSVNFLSLHYPLTGALCYLCFGFFVGLLNRILYSHFWRQEVERLFGNNASSVLKKRIASSIASKNQKLRSGAVDSCFLYCHFSVRSGLDFISDRDGSADYLDELQNRVESAVKKNNGIISNICSDGVFSYYSSLFSSEKASISPFIGDCSLKTVLDLINGSLRKELVLAVHFENEYFAFSYPERDRRLNGRRDRVFRYKNIGTSSLLLEGMVKAAKKFGVRIIVSGAFLRFFSKKLPVRMLDRICVGGSAHSERMFELLSEEEYSKKENMIDYFHAGLKLFEKRKWEEASCYFKQCLRIFQGDTPSEIYYQRCKDFIYVPPSEEWNGVYEVE